MALFFACSYPTHAMIMLWTDSVPEALKRIKCSRYTEERIVEWSTQVTWCFPVLRVLGSSISSSVHFQMTINPWSTDTIPQAHSSLIEALLDSNTSQWITDRLLVSQCTLTGCAKILCRQKLKSVFDNFHRWIKLVGRWRPFSYVLILTV